MSYKRFTAANPFPSYDQVIAAMVKFPDQAMSMEMYSEYGRTHHNLLKKAYESGMDPSVCKEIGQAIYKLGGEQAMRMNYYAFYYFSPFAKSHNPDMFGAVRQFEYAWDGIGTWQSDLKVTTI